MCGSNAQQQEMYQAQHDFYVTLTQQYQTVFGEQQAILKELTSEFQPILAAGPNQKGFAPEEEAAYRSQASEGTAQGYEKTSQAVEEGLAARGGGNVAIPSGANEQLRAEMAGAAAQAESQQQLNITQKNYEVGRQNWQEAERALGQTAGLMSPTSYSESANQGGAAAAKTANDIAQADNSVLSAAFGGLGGLASTAVGNLNVGPFKG